MALSRLRKTPGLPHGLRWGVSLYLLDGPLTMEQIRARYETNPLPALGRPESSLGYVRRGRRLRRLQSRLPTDLSGLVDAGWLALDGDRYFLTPEGQARAHQAMQGALAVVSGIGRRIRSMGEPATASKLTIIAQVVLAAVKLPAGLLSGSVGLLNDSLDTILDLFSSLLVFLGVRFKKERLVSALLVVLMMGTGGFTLYEAVHRFFVPYVPKVEWFPFFTAILSAVVGFILWQYQRFIGRRSGSLAFIAESVDSRNHVFVALGVTAGLAASFLRFGLLDVLVGLCVALLILWSAIELAIEAFRSSAGNEANLSKYRFWLRDVFHNARDRLLRNAMMTLVESGEAMTRPELVARMRTAVDFRQNPWMRAAGLARQLAPDTLLEGVLQESIQQGWLVDGEALVVSEKGKDLLARQARRHSRGRPQFGRRVSGQGPEGREGRRKAMLKTNLDRVAEPDALLVARGILKGYLFHPTLFVLRLVLTLPRTKKRIQKNIPDDIKGLLALTIAMYGLLLKTLEKKKALALVKAVVIPIGLARQHGLLRFVDEPTHSLENLIGYSQRAKVEGPMRLNKMEVTDDADSRYEFRVKNCIFKSVYERFGYPELLEVLCSVDNALYNTYAPDLITFTRGGARKTIAQGNATCDFICALSSPEAV